MLPGIKARGPRDDDGTRPNLHVEFPVVLNGMQPETVIKEAISLHVGVNCEYIHICSTRNNECTRGRSISCELPKEVLNKVQK